MMVEAKTQKRKVNNQRKQNHGKAQKSVCFICSQGFMKVKKKGPITIVHVSAYLRVSGLVQNQGNRRNQEFYEKGDE